MPQDQQPPLQQGPSSKQSKRALLLHRLAKEKQTAEAKKNVPVAPEHQTEPVPVHHTKNSPFLPKKKPDKHRKNNNFSIGRRASVLQDDGEWVTGHVKDITHHQGTKIWFQYDDRSSFPNEWIDTQNGRQIVLLSSSGGPAPKNMQPTVIRTTAMNPIENIGNMSSTTLDFRLPERIPRVLERDEHLLSLEQQQLLVQARLYGETMFIPPKQIWLHETFLTVWYNSFDVGKVVGRIIPAAMSDGFPRTGIKYEKEFTAPLLPPHTSKPLNKHGFEGWKNFISDLKPISQDPTLLTNIEFGFPQSCCCPFATIVFNNAKMDEQSKQEIRDSNQKEIDGGRCSHRLSRDQMEKTMPIFVSCPNNVIPKNSEEKTKLLNNPELTLRDIKTRIIFNVSKKDKMGESVNSRTSYETLHSCRFVTTHHAEAAVLEARDRLNELGLPHEGRINLWKCDVRSAYKTMMSCCADHFLGCHGIDDQFIIEYAQQFGQKSSVTIFHRFVYALTSLMSAPEWANKYFPEMCLDLDPNRTEPRTERPPVADIRKELQKFRDGDGNGVLDPAVFLWISWYLDDFIGITIDIRDDISLPLKPDVDGIRSPIGKALNYFLKRYKIPQHMEKRIKENDVLLMGGQRPIVLGILFDLNELRLYVRPEYAADLAGKLETWVEQGHSKRHQSEEWGLMQGRLGFATIVYPMFRAFMREIWMMYAKILSNDHRAYCASDDVLENMAIMAKVLRINYGRSMFHNDAWRHTFQRGLQHCFKDTQANDIPHDASTGYGFGFFNYQQGKHYFRAWRGKEIQIAKDKKIFELEAMAMFVTFYINKQFLHDSRLNMLGDNMGLVTAMHYCGSSSPLVNGIVRQMVLMLSNVGIQLNCDREKFNVNWIDTHEMDGADALSRNDERAFKKYLADTFEGKTSELLTENDPLVQEAEAALAALVDKYY